MSIHSTSYKNARPPWPESFFTQQFSHGFSVPSATMSSPDQLSQTGRVCRLPENASGSLYRIVNWLVALVMGETSTSPLNVAGRTVFATFQPRTGLSGVSRN